MKQLLKVLALVLVFILAIGVMVACDDTPDGPVDGGGEGDGGEGDGGNTDTGAKFTVTFQYIDREGNALYTTGSEPVSSNKVPNRTWGSTVSNPIDNDPQAFENYVITGWNADKAAAMAGTVDEACTKNIKSDLTLYSVIRDKVNVTVTFLDSKGNPIPNGTRQMLEGSALDASTDTPRPIVTGQYFIKWDPVQDPNATQQSTTACIYADCSFKAVMGATDGTIGKVATGTITVDGIEDPVYAQKGAYLAHNDKMTSTGAYTVEEEKPTGGFGDYAVPDMKADTWMLWDGDFVYLLIKVYDETLVLRSDSYVSSGADAWCNDAIELWYTFEQDASLKTSKTRIGLSALGDVDVDGDGNPDKGSGKYALPRHTYKDAITGIFGGRSTHYEKIEYGVRNAIFDQDSDLDPAGVNNPSYIVELKIPAWTEGAADMDYAFDENGDPLTGDALYSFQQTGLIPGKTANDNIENYAFTDGTQLQAGDFIRLCLQVNDLRITSQDLITNYLDNPSLEQAQEWDPSATLGTLNANIMLYQLDANGKLVKANTTGLFCSTASTQHNVDYYLMFSLNDTDVSDTKVWSLGKDKTARTRPVMYDKSGAVYTRPTSVE